MQVRNHAQNESQNHLLAFWDIWILKRPTHAQLLLYCTHKIHWSNQPFYPAAHRKHDIVQYAYLTFHHSAHMHDAADLPDFLSDWTHTVHIVESDIPTFIILHAKTHGITHSITCLSNHLLVSCTRDTHDTHYTGRFVHSTFSSYCRQVLNKWSI